MGRNKGSRIPQWNGGVLRYNNNYNTSLGRYHPSIIKIDANNRPN